MRIGYLGMIACAALVASVPAHAGLIFNITYTTAVQSDPNFTNIQNAVSYVTNELSNLYSDNVTLNFTVDKGNVGLGQSTTPLYSLANYGVLKDALVADAKTADDGIATNSTNLPVSDPYGGSWVMTGAQGKALGLIGANNAASDGTFTFSSAPTYTYDPNNRGTGGFDFIGVTEHEFSEMMGRITTVGSGLSSSHLIMDTMRFTGPGVRSINSADSNVYFSFDNGNTNLAVYNSTPGGDYQDLNGAVATDPYNAFTSPDQAHSLNPVDITTLDVIGWDLRASVATPEPAQFAPVLLALGAILARTRKRSA